MTVENRKNVNGQESVVVRETSFRGTGSVGENNFAKSDGLNFNGKETEKSRKKDQVYGKKRKLPSGKKTSKTAGKERTKNKKKRSSDISEGGQQGGREKTLEKKGGGTRKRKIHF